VLEQRLHHSLRIAKQNIEFNRELTPASCLQRLAVIQTAACSGSEDPPQVGGMHQKHSEHSNCTRI
jgi:hypothetical protein